MSDRGIYVARTTKYMHYIPLTVKKIEQKKLQIENKRGYYFKRIPKVYEL